MTTIDDGPPRTSPKPIEAVARAIWQRREQGFPKRVQRMEPDAMDMVTGAFALVAADAAAAIITLISLGYITQAGIAAFKDEKGKDGK